MPQAKPKVLIIDDDSIAQKFITHAICDNYDVKTANDGLSGIDEATHWQPSVILLEVEMPGKNGYETCELIKENTLTQHIPVIFISGRSSLRERLIGFEAGGDDYLTKPCEKELINAKVHYIYTQAETKKALNDQVKIAERIATDAIKGSAEIGKAIRFVEKMYSITSFDYLITELFKTMKEFGLNTSVLIRSTQGDIYRSSADEIISPLEEALLCQIKDQGRFYDFGCRTACNFRQVTLLIKNMPLSDPERYGRIKDTVPFVLGSIDEKVLALDTQNTMLAQAESLTKSTDAIRITLDNISQQSSQSQERMNSIMAKTMSDLDFMLPRMGLDDDQEASITNRLDQTFVETTECLDIASELKQSLTGVVRLLCYISEQQNKLVNNAKTETPPEVDEVSIDDELLGDVELF
ncbi:MAG: response regulator [Oleispira sp.]